MTREEAYTARANQTVIVAVLVTVAVLAAADGFGLDWLYFLAGPAGLAVAWIGASLLPDEDEGEDADG